jgi:hypothetical protein
VGSDVNDHLLSSEEGSGGVGIETSWNLLDHKWNNLNRWVEGIEKKFGSDTKVPLSSIKKTMAMADKIEKDTDEAIINALFPTPLTQGK